MAYVAAALFVAATVTSIISKHKAAKAEAEQLRRQSILLGQRADRVLENNRINTDRIKVDIKKTQGKAATKFAQSGSTIDINSLADIAMDGAREIAFRNKMAEFEAEAIRLGADATLTNAANTRRAAEIAGFGQGLSAAAQVAQSANK